MITYFLSGVRAEMCGYKHTAADNRTTEASLQMVARQISVFLWPQLPVQKRAEVMHVCVPVCVLYRNGLFYYTQATNKVLYKAGDHAVCLLAICKNPVIMLV